MSFYLDAIDRLCKAGKLQRAWRLGYKQLAKTPDDVMIKRAIFHVMLAYIRQYNQVIQEKYENRLYWNREYEELHQIEYVVEKALELSMPWRDTHITLLKECLLTLEFLPTLVRFVLEYYRVLFVAEDARPQRTKAGGSQTSLMYKVAMSVFHHYEHQRDSQLYSFAQLNQFMEYMRRKLQDKKPRIWLEMNFAKCLIKAGKIQEARMVIGHYLATHWRTYYFWALLGDLYQEEPQKALECYMTGLRMNGAVTYVKHAMMRVPALFKQVGEERAARLFEEKKEWLLSHWPESAKETFAREPRCQTWIQKYAQNFAQYWRVDHRESHGVIRFIDEKGKFFLLEGTDVPLYRLVPSKLCLNIEPSQWKEGMRVRFCWTGDLENFTLIAIYP